MPETVLLMAAVDDGEARRVANELRRRGHTVALLDLSWFPQHAYLIGELGASGWEGQLVTPHGTVELSDISGVYHRRCPPFEPPSGLNQTEHRFATVESRFGVGGILASLPAHWVSHPAAMADAEYKPLQLAEAVRAGLPVPRTWVGNDPAKAQAFVSAQSGGAVHKPLMHKLVADQGSARLIYTNAVQTKDIDDRVRSAPHQFQERVRASHDVRALITGHGCEAVAIRAGGGEAFLDYRNHYDHLVYERVRLDPELVIRSQRLLARLNLASGVFDFAVSTAGGTVFYEVNPAGQWAWLEEETQAPMTALICDALTGAAV
ncbi:MvdC/MvdD family ATP grasp protein [Nocardiopsis terrae]